MKNLPVFLTLILLVQFSCQKKQPQVSEEFILKGKLLDNSLFDGHHAYLAKMADDLENYIYLDSTLINNSEFVFKGKAINDTLEGRYIFVGFRQTKSYIEPELMFIPEGGNIEMLIDSNYYPTLSGTVQNERLAHLQNIQKNIHFKIKELEKDKDGDQEVQMETVMKLAKEINTSVYPYMKSIAGNPLLDEMYVKYFMFLGNPQRKEFQELLGERYHNKRKNDSIQHFNEGKAIIGEPFFDVTCVNIEGKDVKLSQHAGKGKIILLDFWASWCKPCRQDFPMLKELHSKYKDKGFDIVSISIDTDINSWKKAIADEKLTWTQLVSKENIGKESVRAIYGTNSIPHTVLLDNNGMVTAKNIRGESIEKELVKLLDNEKR